MVERWGGVGGGRRYGGGGGWGGVWFPGDKEMVVKRCRYPNVGDSLTRWPPRQTADLPNQILIFVDFKFLGLYSVQCTHLDPILKADLFPEKKTEGRQGSKLNKLLR